MPTSLTIFAVPRILNELKTNLYEARSRVKEITSAVEDTKFNEV